MSKSRPFSGRVIFDHLPKTAGQAINAWLRASLGTGCVTSNLTGNHLDLIKRAGGEYSIISAHVAFSGEGFDPRYQYVTCLREPIDRILSWLFFVRMDRAGSPLAPSRPPCTVVDAFIESGGRLPDSEGAADALRHHICNYYVEHFAAIEGTPATTEAEKLTKALASIEQYDVWGLYEALPQFLADFAVLVGVPSPSSIDRVNATRARPRVNDISPRLRQSLEELNALDREFYWALSERYEAARKEWQRASVPVMPWTPTTRPADRTFTAPEFALISAELEGNNATAYPAGGLLSFVVCFSIAVAIAELEIGIHVFDQDKRWAFGTNTTLLGKPLRDLAPGSYRIRYALAAKMPAGDYTGGFAFAAREASGTLRELAWYDALFTFHIAVQRLMPSIGYVGLPVAIDFQASSGQVVRLVSDAAGMLVCSSALGDITPEELISLPVTVINTSSQDWVTQHLHPIALSYRWLDDIGRAVTVEGQRTPLPRAQVPSGGRMALRLSVFAPERPGQYRLQALPVQGASKWFDELGFSPLEIAVNVVPLEAPRFFPATDPRLYSRVGRIEGAELISTGAAGFLLFGPYARLPKGNWRAELTGTFNPGPATLRAEVAAGEGRQILAREDISSPNKSLKLVFELITSVEDLEVRLWVPAQGNAAVASLRIAPDMRLSSDT